MESNVKLNVTASTQSNGNISIAYKNSSSLGWLGVVLIILSVSFSLSGLFVVGNLRFLNIVGYILYGVVGSLIGWWLLPSRRKGIITVIPGEGLISKKIQLAFKDIETIGTSMGNYNIGKVYCVVGGSNVIITGLVTKSVADSIVRLIQEYSGSTWA
jgi:hypothetical protein